MADRQMAGITGNATMRVPITGDVNVGGRAVRELRFMPRSAFPEVGRSDVLYIDTLGECIYYWNGSEYVQLSGGGSGTDNYNSLQNRPKINNVTLEGEQTSSDLGLQSSIDDLSSIRSGASAGATALQPEDVDTLPTDGSSNPVSSGGTYDFVNSSIATNTAYFIGTFASVAELEAYTGTVTNNDYAFVTSTDSAGNTLYNRYKYNAATQTWSFEYAVNNTAFTTAQWAAIQSGLTASDKTKLDGIEQGANKTVIDASPTSGSSNAVSSGGVHTALSGKQDTIADLSDIRSGASAGATAVQPSALTDYQTKLSGTNKLDPSYIDYDASHRAVSDTEKSTWNGKQDVISDLSTIRSGAAAGATALQQSDVTSTYSASGIAPVNGTAVNAAIGTLDVSSVGGTGQYISAIGETDGKIEATPTTFDTSLSSSSTNNNAPTSKAVYDDQQRQEVEIGAVANRGAKNLLPDKHAVGNAVETNGFRFTPQSDGGIKIESIGTHSANGDYYIQGNWGNTVTVLDLSDDTYAATISCETTISGISLRIFGANNTPIVNNIYLNNETNFTGEVKFIFITVISTAVIPSGGIIVYPMIRHTSITDSTFVPYAKTNAELTVVETEDRAALIAQVDAGAKNKLNNALISKTESNVILTLNADKTVSVSTSGASTAQVTAKLLESSGNYAVNSYSGMILSGCPSGGSADGYCLYLAYSNNGSTQIGTGIIIAENESVVISNNPYLQIFILVRSGVDIGTTPVIFKPMICTAADWAISKKYVPYAKTNRELTVENDSQQSEINYAVNTGAKNLLRFDLESVKSLNGGTWNGNTNTINGVTITINDTDKTISFVKTASGGDVYFRLTTALQSILSSGSKYILSGATGGSSTTFYLGNSGNWENMNGDTEITYTGSFASIYVCVKSTMPLNTTITIKPMIRPASITDSTFQPYALPNPTLTPAAIKAVDEGAKNLFPIGVSSYTYESAVTCTVTTDGKITVNGTNPNASDKILYQDLVTAETSWKNTRYTLPAGKYGCKGSGVTGLTIQVYCHDGTNAKEIFNGKDDGVFEYTAEQKAAKPYIAWRLGISASAAISNATVHPMICTAADWAISQKVVPYAPTNRELYDMIKALQNA